LSGPLTESIGNFVKGNFLDGMSKILSVGLKTVLGNFNGQKSEKQAYFIVLGESGGILRIDYLIYAFEYKSE
jgi:hypothetical protein